jgi:hypothetical protein
MIPDPAVPRRDALLRPETMAELVGVPVERCERTYVKYRVGESLRVVYRCGDTHVAARTGARGDIALYRFPNDRKLDLAAVGRLLDETTTPRLVAWAAEQSATFECRDPSGRVVAYARVQRDAAPWPALEGVRTPRVLRSEGGVLLLEALEGERLDRAPRGLEALGAALAACHANTLAAPRFVRHDPERLVTAANAIARVRPDAGPAARRLLERLLVRIDDGEDEPVLLHGDANLRNALLLPGGTVALLDLEDVSTGPAAADLGQVLAALLVTRTPHGAQALLAGYGDPPGLAALRWHTAAAILARQALPAVSRFRPGLLARLRELLEAGGALVAPKAVAA